MSVPIFDDAYMRRVNALQRAAAWSNAMCDAKGIVRSETKSDPINEARDLYATGKITLGEFSARVDVALGSRTTSDRSAA